MITRDIAICIRVLDYSETSQIVTFFSRAAGKISVMAKGSRRPKSSFEGPIEILSSGQIIFIASESAKLGTLMEFDQQMPPHSLATNLSAMNCSFFAAELVNLLTDDYDPHPELFDSFQQFLNSTAESGNKTDTLVLLIFFQLALLREIGLRPNFNNCVNCKKSFDKGLFEIYFSNSANGLICRDCESSFIDKIKLSDRAAKCLVSLKTISGADEKTLQEIERLLIHHFTVLLHKCPKMAKHVLSL